MKHFNKCVFRELGEGGKEWVWCLPWRNAQDWYRTVGKGYWCDWFHLGFLPISRTTKVVIKSTSQNLSPTSLSSVIYKNRGWPRSPRRNTPPRDQSLLRSEGGNRSCSIPKLNRNEPTFQRMMCVRKDARSSILIVFCWKEVSLEVNLCLQGAKSNGGDM